MTKSTSRIACIPNKKASAIEARLRVFFSVLFFWGVPFFLFQPAYGEPVTPTHKFQVIGSALIVKDDFSAARTAAVTDSLAAAVDKAVMDLLPREALVRQFGTVGETLSGNADRFIQEYKVLTEAVVGSKYRVFIEAVVWMDRVREDLFRAGIAEARRELPGVLLFFTAVSSRENGPAVGHPGAFTIPLPSPETGVAEALSKKGYRVLRSDTGIPASAETGDASTGGSTDIKALNTGKRLEADVVVIGEILTDPMPAFPREAGLPSREILRLRALKTDTGREIAGVSYPVPASDDDGGGSNATARYDTGRLAGADLAEQIARNWIREAEAVASISLRVRGTQRLGNFVTFRRRLADLPGVKKMQIEEILTNEAAIQVAFTGTASLLANTLAQTTFEAFEVLILETAPDRILLALSHREPDLDMEPPETR